MLLMIATAGLVCSGCAVVGPSAIRGGRSVYNEAIIATNNQQVLAMIVNMRYSEPTGLLAVASVTANVRVQASAGAQFGIGPESSYAGNLVPLSAGILYEENPTISYSPVTGEKYLRQLLSPIPLDLTLLLLATPGDAPLVMTLLVKSINGIRNPTFLDDAAEEVDPRFARVAELLSWLGRRGHVTWAQKPEEPPSFALVLRGEGEAYGQRVVELFELLEVGPPGDLQDMITVPVSVGVGCRGERAIQLTMRSAYDLFLIAAAAVDVPEDHLKSGLAPALPPPGPAVASIHIRRSEQQPRLAMVAVQHHGWWYAIEGTDATSKQTFRVLAALMTDRMADNAAASSAMPILTVPVSR